jgi:hypothetical protein
MVYLIAKTLQMSIESHRGRPRLAVSYPPEFSKELLKDGFPYRADGQLFRIDLYDFFAGLVAGVFDDVEKRKSRRDTTSRLTTISFVSTLYGDLASPLIII